MGAGSMWVSVGDAWKNVSRFGIWDRGLRMVGVRLGDSSWINHPHSNVSLNVELMGLFLYLQ